MRPELALNEDGQHGSRSSGCSEVSETGESASPNENGKDGSGRSEAKSGEDEDTQVQGDQVTHVLIHLGLNLSF